MRRDLNGNPGSGVMGRGYRFLDGGLKRLADVLVAGVLLTLLALPIAAIVLLIRLDSPGPGFYRCRRIGFRGREFMMLKFRKMHDDASGPALTTKGDARFTRLGHFLAKSKLDEIPQLWNVLKGDMSFVGSRPEDPSFVEELPEEFELILSVRPGITGLSQLAFANESEILDLDDSVGHYKSRILPQKVLMDQLYATRRTLLMDARILYWTAAAVLLRREVAVHRGTGRMNVRRRSLSRQPVGQLQPVVVRQSVEGR